MEFSNEFMQKMIRVTLRPFVRLLLRYGVGYGDFSAVVKRLFIEVAEQDFPIEKRKQTISRISVLTGITRREIKKILEQNDSGEHEYFVYNHAARIITYWLNDQEFQTTAGSTASLSINDEGAGTFDALVRKHGNNTPSRAILDELIRVGAVEVDGRGFAHLMSVGYVPSEDTQELLSVSLQSVADQLSTIDYNDLHQRSDSRLQLTVNYDNVTDDGVEVFRQISRDKCHEVLLFLDRLLATQDRDNNPAVTGDGTNRTGLGIFFFQENLENKSND